MPLEKSRCDSKRCPSSIVAHAAVHTNKPIKDPRVVGQPGDHTAPLTFTPTVLHIQVPTAVNDRILRRIFTFAGLPTVLGFGLFPLFYWLKVWITADTLLYPYAEGAVPVRRGCTPGMHANNHILRCWL